MVRISSGTWKFIRPLSWVSPAMVSPPWNGGPSEPIRADPGRSAAAWKERGIVLKRSTVARHCGPDHGRAALALGSLALAAFGQPVEHDRCTALFVEGNTACPSVVTWTTLLPILVVWSRDEVVRVDLE